MQKRKNISNIGINQLIIKHLNENLNVYFKVFLIFIIGICIGIAVVNHLPEVGMQTINDYISNSITILKNDNEIDKLQILKSSLFKNVIIVLLIWFLGLTLVGGFILYLLTLILGITFGYTLSAIMTSFTFIQGALFFLTGMFLQNLFSIPSIIFLIVQGINSNKAILVKKNNSLKYIVAKQSIYSIIVMIFLILASLIEAYVSGKLVHLIAIYL